MFKIKYLAMYTMQMLASAIRKLVYGLSFCAGDPYRHTNHTLHVNYANTVYFREHKAYEPEF